MRDRRPKKNRDKKRRGGDLVRDKRPKKFSGKKGGGGWHSSQQSASSPMGLKRLNATDDLRKSSPVVHIFGGKPHNQVKFKQSREIMVIVV